MLLSIFRPVFVNVRIAFVVSTGLLLYQVFVYRGLLIFVSKFFGHIYHVGVLSSLLAVQWVSSPFSKIAIIFRVSPAPTAWYFLYSCQVSTDHVKLHNMMTWKMYATQSHGRQRTVKKCTLDVRNSSHLQFFILFERPGLKMQLRNQTTYAVASRMLSSFVCRSNACMHPIGYLLRFFSFVASTLKSIFSPSPQSLMCYRCGPNVFCNAVLLYHWWRW